MAHSVDQTPQVRYGVKGGCRRQVDGTTGLLSASEMLVRQGSYAWCQGTKLIVGGGCLSAGAVTRIEIVHGGRLSRGAKCRQPHPKQEFSISMAPSPRWSSHDDRGHERAEPLCGQQRAHIHSCKRFAAFLNRSPDTRQLRISDGSNCTWA